MLRKEDRDLLYIFSKRPKSESYGEINFSSNMEKETKNFLLGRPTKGKGKDCSKEEMDELGLESTGVS